MTSSCHKIYGLVVHTKRKRCRFQIYALWDPVSKNCVLRLPKCWIRLDETPMSYTIFTYTAKCVSVCDIFLYACVDQMNS